MSEPTDNQEIEAGELDVRGIGRVVWTSQALPKETARDAAKRFVLEFFGVERIPLFFSEGEFRFDDGYWCYRISVHGDKWQVEKTPQLTPKAKKRARARREARHGDANG